MFVVWHFIVVFELGSAPPVEPSGRLLASRLARPQSLILSGGCFCCFGGRMFAARFLLFLLMDPGMSLVCHLCKQQQVVTTETVGRGPLFVLPVKAGECGVETNARFGLVFPDSGFNGAEPDLVCWFLFCIHIFRCVVVLSGKCSLFCSYGPRRLIGGAGRASTKGSPSARGRGASRSVSARLSNASSRRIRKRARRTCSLTKSAMAARNSQCASATSRSSTRHAIRQQRAGSRYCWTVVVSRGSSRQSGQGSPLE